MSKRKEREAAIQRAFVSLKDNPAADLLVEDLAASREHGRETARVAIAPDGNPIVYGRSRTTVARIGKAMQHASVVHTRDIPELSHEQFAVLAAQSKLLANDDGDDDGKEKGS